MSEASRPRDAFLEELRWRGFFQQCTDEAGLADLLARETVTAYIGFDPTADSLHVGSMLPIMGLVHLQRHGHKPIAIAGGGTAMVGDPSGKTELRQLLTVEQIEANLRGIKAQLARFVDFGEPGLADLPHGPVVQAGPDNRGILLNNADWLADKNYIEFLRDVGRHFSVNQMLARDSVKTRLEVGLSFIEFNYMILQAYDFYVLNRDHGCRLQMGGNDQWGNICSGVDLCRRLNQQEVYGLTFPLLATATGAKMGKTAAGAVWISPERTSPYDFFQYWVNVDDRDVSRFLRLYTLLDRERIEELEALEGADIREAKRALARAATALVHGPEAADAAAKAAVALFVGGGDESTVPGTAIDPGRLAGAGLELLEALTETGLCKSKGEARRLVRQGGVKVNDAVVADETRRLTASDVADGRIRLQLGKKRHHHLVPREAP
ncbi:MAG TPA: tyrosine--tRNA ligase [Candidatus Krumholzibacteria bacterium]|nr:tyrosine--tRNA ligase [Candidatus Krumholzibacteria bacterium]HPD72012.1 tyrosine--tRNA ligase [Candidatus Krumholzibacteria bacterium]HRY41055.1 tyrosine--tRNA ligase [Candidatus Krumholzibacteria bacterium]